MARKEGLWPILYDYLASLKLSIVIFLTLAACSVLGTLLPQGVAVEELRRHYSPALVWWIDTFGLNDLYHTGWFRLLLLLLCVNLIVCSLRRLPKTLKLFQRREERVDPEMLTRLALHRRFTIPLPWGEASPRLQKLVGEELGPVRSLDSGNGYGGLVEKGRWSLFMVYVVHLSVLLILLGALAGSMFGFKGFMNIPEGQASEEVMLSTPGHAVTLPFQVRCDDFDVSFYDNGAPKEFRSDLTILEGGKEVHRQSIRVNDPLTFRGITFYQSSYGSTLKQVEVEFQDRDKGQVHTMALPLGEIRSIPGTQDRIQVVDFQENLGRMGAAVAIAMAREGQEPTGSWILMDKPDFHGNRVGPYQLKVLRSERSQYTGLQVKQDPGIKVVWLGFLSMLLGIALAFYSSHSKVWVWAAPASASKETTTVLLAGRTNKNSFAFERDFDQLCERIESELNAETKRK